MKGGPAPALRFGTLAEALASAARTKEGLTFVDLREHERELSWAALLVGARRAAAVLGRVGVRRGDRVALLYGTGPDFFTAFFGALFAGAVPVPLYPPVRLGRMDEYHAATGRMLDSVGARLVLAIPRVRRLLGRTVARGTIDLGCRSLAELQAGAPDERDQREVAVAPDALALIQFSSGTTSSPKPVALTHRNLLSQCASLHALMPGVRPVGVLWLPLYHDMGLVGSLLGTYYPGSVVLIPPELFLARPALWLRAISRHRASISTAPNFAYALCEKRIRDEQLAGVDLSSWRFALDGAEAISPAVVRRFSDRFAAWGFDRAALTPVYGLSEATLAVTFSPRDRGLEVAAIDPTRLARTGEAHAGPREVVAVGRPVPGVEVEVRGAGGRAQPERAAGRIFVRGPSVTNGYFTAPASAPSTGAIEDGWLDTGDLGFVIDGSIYVCGRAKDLVILRGSNHSPEEFEECLDEVSGVRPGCAVALGLPSSEGEELLILAERGGAPGPRTTAAGTAASDLALSERIRAAVLHRTGVRPYAVQLLAPGTLPRTSSGKRRRQEALRRYLLGELTPPRPVTRTRIFAELLRSALAFARLRWSPAR